MKKNTCMRKRMATVFFLLLLIPAFFLGGNAFGAQWPTFSMSPDLHLPPQPDKVMAVQALPTELNIEQAMKIAETLGFGGIKPQTDYYYTMPPVETPLKRDKINGTAEQPQDDEKTGGTGETTLDNPTVLWPPKGAVAKTKIFIFQDPKTKQVLTIGEKNGTVTYADNAYLGFSGEKIVDLTVSPDEMMKLVDNFINTARKADPNGRDILFLTNRHEIPEEGSYFEPELLDKTAFRPLTLNRADMKTGRVLESHVIAQEITFTRMLCGCLPDGQSVPVVGGGGVIRMTVGTGANGEPGIAFYSKLARGYGGMGGAWGDVMVAPVSTAFEQLQSGKNILNSNLRFTSQGTLVVDAVRFAYYAPSGYEDAETLTPVWCFQVHDAKDPENSMEFFVKAESIISCSSAHPDACTDEKSCVSAGGSWCDQLCQAEACETCDANHPALCDNEDGCDSAGGYWYDDLCHESPEATGAGGHNGMPDSALPLVDFPATPVNPTNNEVHVGACPEVIIQPVMKGSAADVGKTAQLIMYIYLPDFGFGIPIPSKSVTLSAETTCDLLPPTINLSGNAGLRFFVYYGYVLGSSIKYAAYSVVVDPFCADDCGTITDASICNATPDCVYQNFPVAKCIMNCAAYKSMTSCESAFDGDSCMWNETFSTCMPK